MGHAYIHIKTHTKITALFCFNMQSYFCSFIGWFMFGAQVLFQSLFKNKRKKEEKGKSLMITELLHKTDQRTELPFLFIFPASKATSP